MSRLRAIQHKRFKQLFSVTSIAMAIIAFNALVNEVYFDAAALFIAVGAISLLAFYAHLDTVQRFGGTIFTSIITLLVISIMWTSNGIKDNSVFSLPIILMFAGLTGNRKWFISLLCFMSLNLLAMGLFNELGTFNPKPARHTLTSAIDITIILLLSGYAIRLVMNDNMNLLKELEREVHNANVSRDELAYAAFHDDLTGLPNRASAERVFKEVFARSKRSNTTAALLVLDLDNFKSINDVYGHSHGDRFLQQTSLRLRTEMRQTDHLFRLGGDEFIILLEGFDSDGDIVMVLEKLVNTVSKPLPVSTAQVSCKPSIGVVLIPKDSSTFEEATKRGDLSMYEAKRNPNTNYHFYNAQTELEILEKYQLENDLSQALDNHELTVHFQPIINLADNRILGAEALIRWNHPAKGLISPESFIPIAEKIGIIDRVSRFVIESSCDLISAVQASNPNFYVSVNITPTQLQQENLLKRLTHDTNVRYFSFLKFEVTESHFMEDINTMRLNVEQIQNIGVEFYLDDFGTGYSNIGNLQKLAFKTLKIDRSFTKSIHRNTASEKLVHGIALMTKRMGLDIVAEGVESGQEADRLRSIGITRAQGYHWSRPVDATVFLTLPGLSL